jgi:hypothetical protein
MDNDLWQTSIPPMSGLDWIDGQEYKSAFSWATYWDWLAKQRDENEAEVDD